MDTTKTDIEGFMAAARSRENDPWAAKSASNSERAYADKVLRAE